MAPSGSLGREGELGIDWGALRAAARGAAGRAYAPYSGLQVGAAGLCQDGEIVASCNVENASYGLTLCAECGLVSAAVAGGHGGVVAVSVLSGDGRHLPPCGRCRQVLMEAGGPGLLVDAGEGCPPRPLRELLPGAFDRAELAGPVASTATQEANTANQEGGAPK
jgi:cytidine deaminase